MKLLKCAILSLAAALTFSGCSDNEKVNRSFFAMDTYMSVTAYGSGNQQAVNNSEQLVISLENLWSVTKQNSDIGLVNSSDGNSTVVSPRTAEIISYAKDMNVRTGGALDISLYPVVKEWGFTNGNYHIPDDARISELLKYVNAKDIAVKDNWVTLRKGMMIDLGAVAKGYAADLIAEQLVSEGVSSAAIDLGGNVRTVGKKPNGEKWVIGLRSPESDGLFGTLSTDETAIATSGGYERYFKSDGKRYCHILDPKTGRPAESGLLSVSVIAPEAKLCDALSTALFVLGADKAEELRKSLGGFEYIIVTDKHEVLVSSGVFDGFELDSSCSDWKVTKI